MIKHRIRCIFALLSISFFFSLPANALEPKVDFNGDGRSDVFLQNIYTGALAAWFIGGSSILQKASYPTVSPSTGWTVIGLRDFNGDGSTDILWYNRLTGEVYIWLINAGNISQQASIGTVPINSGWTPISLGDFNGDSRTDILWYNIYSGTVAAWLIGGSTVLQTVAYGTAGPNSGWLPIGLKDLNGDGRDDIFWYNVNTGGIDAWLISGVAVLQDVFYGAVSPNSGWVPIGLSDLNGDGRNDILWRNTFTGEVSVWFVNGGSIIQQASYGSVAINSGWTPIGLSDFNGDGRSDILWRNAFSGEIYIWLINGNSVMQMSSLGTVSPSSGWVPAGLGDFNGDGRKDIFWYNGFSNDTAAWLINGNNIIQAPSYDTVPPSSVWQVRVPG